MSDPGGGRGLARNGGGSRRACRGCCCGRPRSGPCDCGGIQGRAAVTASTGGVGCGRHWVVV
eukprot:7143888-Pyramimonas_sp.AAC.1